MVVNITETHFRLIRLKDFSKFIPVFFYNEGRKKIFYRNRVVTREIRPYLNRLV